MNCIDAGKVDALYRERPFLKRHMPQDQVVECHVRPFDVNDLGLYNDLASGEFEYSRRILILDGDGNLLAAVGETSVQMVPLFDLRGLKTYSRKKQSQESIYFALRKLDNQANQAAYLLLLERACPWSSNTWKLTLLREERRTQSRPNPKTLSELKKRQDALINEKTKEGCLAAYEELDIEPKTKNQQDGRYYEEVQIYYGRPLLIVASLMLLASIGAYATWSFVLSLF
ncbi:MAG: hypothetical protein WCV92_00265 [Candidatus Buchananbacteria bacterium]